MGITDRFLELACTDPILANGPAAHAERQHAALRILKRHPEIARANIHTAAVCGEIDEVRRILAARPEAATEAGGPERRRERPERSKLWTPLLHVCYGRLPLNTASDNAVAIARLLLDHGANANDYFEVGSHPCHHSALCGVAGEGEDIAPPHPHREALARLLMEHGAEPYDTQAIYNTHLRGDMLWYVRLMHEFSVKAGRQAQWDDPEWWMLGHPNHTSGARYFLSSAIEHNNLKLAEWCLAHGANPNAAPSARANASKRTLHEEAVLRGFTEMAALLESYGAVPSATPARDGIEEFAAACLRLDRTEVAGMLEQHPEYLHSPVPIFLAAGRNRADVVAFLLDLGVPIEIEDETKQRPLHVAAGADALQVAALLIERGADTEARETQWNNMPLDHAMWGNLTRMIEFLGRFTRDVFRLTHIGNLARLREVLARDPESAKRQENSYTPLMWLPDDEARAAEMAWLLLEHGADPSIKSQEGKTAADYAEELGLYAAADLLKAGS